MTKGWDNSLYGTHKDGGCSFWRVKVMVGGQSFCFVVPLRVCFRSELQMNMNDLKRRNCCFKVSIEGDALIGQYIVI